jgi:ribonucleotide reductase beta subunit family protein with ferritin-like domain
VNEKSEKQQFRCSICGKSYTNILYKVNCEKSHNVYYVPIYREDISKLLQFIYQHYDPDEGKVLPERLITIFTNIMKTRMGSDPDLSFNTLYKNEE